MDQAKLADEIRGAGFAVRYADGPVIGGSYRNGKFRSMQSPRTKLKTPDWKVIRMASTCHACDAVASKTDRELAQEWADCYQSFARLIWPCINHEPYCEATPYIPVSEKASSSFAKVKARFEARRKALQSGDVASKPPKSSMKSKNKRNVKKPKRRMTDADAFALSLIQGFNAWLAEQVNQEKPAAKGKKKKKSSKKATAAKKPAKKKPVRNSGKKKPVKRRRR